MCHELFSFWNKKKTAALTRARAPGFALRRAARRERSRHEPPPPRADPPPREQERRAEVRRVQKRHAQDFGGLGYADVTFTFDGEGDPEADGEQRDAGRRAADAPSATEDTAPPVRGHRTDGVDIRL